MTGLLTIARLFLHVRESGPNAGLRVEAIQKWCDGETGDSWCCEMATMWLDLHFGGQSPVPRLRAVQDVLDLARKNGWVVNIPMPGDLVLSVNDAGHGHHIAVCSGTSPLRAIAGNTTADGSGDNGDRVAEHAITVAGKVFVRVPGVVA